jgi:uncharacterized membrane protein YkgB
MVCSVTCTIAFIFIVGKIYFYNATTNDKVVKHYKEKLPTDLKILYDKLTKERLHISLYGYGLGLIISLLIIYYNLKLKKDKLNNLSLVCLVISVTFITNYFYYILSPKSDWMLNHINNQEQSKAWLQIYRTMQVNYHLGFVFGIIAAGILAFAFRC